MFDLFETFLRLIAFIINSVSQTVPRYICVRVPLMPQILCGGMFYLFTQALALLLIVGNGMIASLSTQVVHSAMEDTVPFFDRPLRALVVCYVYYCVFDSGYYFGYSMWTAAWEGAYDFPTVRLLILGKRSGETARDTATQTYLGEEDDAVSVTESPLNKAHTGSVHRRGVRRQMVIVIPWVMLVSLVTFMLAMLTHCQGWLGNTTGQDFTCAMFDPAARLNRNLRVAIFIMTCQLFQAWTAIFPSWCTAVIHAKQRLLSTACTVKLLLLLPLLLMRMSLWILKPVGLGLPQHLLYLGVPQYMIDKMVNMPHIDYVMDCGLIAGISSWLLLLNFVVSHPDNIGLSGFSVESLSQDYHIHSTMFKFTLLFWQTLHVLRGCVAHGLEHMMNDLVTITLIYPMLFCLIWTVTFVMIRVSLYKLGGRHQKLLFALGSTVLILVSWLLCELVDRGAYPLLAMFVWMHLCRQGLFLMHRWAKWATTMTRVTLRRRSTQIRFCTDPTRAESAQRRVSYQLQRQVGRLIVRIFLISVASFAAILVLCAVMATLQQRSGFFVEEGIIRWRPVDAGIQITNAGASVLTLTTHNASWKGNSTKVMRTDESGLVDVMGRIPSYAICGHQWHALQLVDFTLLSLLPYFKPTDHNNLPELLRRLMPHMDITITRLPGMHTRRRPWMELLLRRGEKEITIVVVAGTLVDRVEDYLENIRMWTEPVVLHIFQTVFPTIRAWPRSTTALVIGTMHQLLASMAVPDNQWQYREVLEHVRGIPVDREVVLTGHSLGGGIALIVGALTRRLAIAIQPPGVYHTLAKHQAQQDDTETHVLHQKSFSLIVEGDVIQHFDHHGGLVQTLMCDQTDKSMTMGCHLLEGAICHLLWHCGDEAQRFASCQHEYQPMRMTMSVLNAVSDFLSNTWRSSQIYQGMPELQSVIIAGVAVSASFVARYGAPWASSTPS